VFEAGADLVDQRVGADTSHHKRDVAGRGLPDSCCDVEGREHPVQVQVQGRLVVRACLSPMSFIF